MYATMSTQQSTSPGTGPLARAARLGLWALPVWAALLCISTVTEQPNPKTDLAGWSRYVTTGPFLASHLGASILGAAIGALGMIALGAVLASRGRPRAGLWVMVTGVFANVVGHNEHEATGESPGKVRALPGADVERAAKFA
jgi:hypothetical protein